MYCKDLLRIFIVYLLFYCDNYWSGGFYKFLIISFVNRDKCSVDCIYFYILWIKYYIM